VARATAVGRYPGLAGASRDAGARPCLKIV